MELIILQEVLTFSMLLSSDILQVSVGFENLLFKSQVWKLWNYVKVRIGSSICSLCSSIDAADDERKLKDMRLLVTEHNCSSKVFLVFESVLGP